VAFGRRSKRIDESVDEVAAAEAVDHDLGDEGADADTADNAGDRGSSGPDGAQDQQGPFDGLDAAGDPPEGWGRIDLGAMHLTVPAGVEVRMDVDQNSGLVNAVVVMLEPLALQVMAYAAPRTLGIWDEVREQISGSLGQGGGSATQREGRFGPEILAQVPSDEGRVEARFMGVDGPRWFLRGVISGSGAHDDLASARALEVFAATIVVRDDEARPSQEPLPVVLPKGAAPGA
jgi:hypothetical protein